VLQSALANVVFPVPGGPESSSRELRSDQPTSLSTECLKVSLEIKRPSPRIAITCQPLNEQAIFPLDGLADCFAFGPLPGSDLIVA
jgi:hypothetical protein